MVRGIILAGGSGTRLCPLTFGCSKQLVPIYDKPLIYYPLSTLMLADIQDILVITTPHDSSTFHRLLGTGSQFGINITYATQSTPAGLAEAFLIGEAHIGSDAVALALGDNILHGPGLGTSLQRFRNLTGGAIFGYKVADPSAYGVVEFDERGRAVSIEEKPAKPRSHWAVPGIYFYDTHVVEYARSLRPSHRGELEITDLSRHYLAVDQLHVEPLQRGTAWFDAGTIESLNAASNYVRTIEHRQGVKVGCPEEIAWRMGFLDDDGLWAQAQKFEHSGYGLYLQGLLQDNAHHSAALDEEGEPTAPWPNMAKSS
uniref:Glucose-1-phosphate thymidylyltransferase n=1 Tax=uncultured bacterium esnapd12 TaxID=1366592 RepID=S5TL01_9BACT|nr:glucose-1-phosphate thymidylyltransferase [uncultured bacterium esnapd12]